MAPQIDTAQRRAEAIACEIHFLNIEHITERPRHCDDGYDGGCGGRDGECAVIKTANIVRVALAETRRAALDEASKVCNERAAFYEAEEAKAGDDKRYRLTRGIQRNEASCCAHALDRLREGVGK